MTDFDFDIEKEGWKLWQEIHIKAFESTTPEKKREFDIYIHDLQQKFMCLECKNHFAEYLEKIPPRKYQHKKDHKGRDIGYFYWSWEFHDKVNKRLKKKRWSYKETYNFYKKKVIEVRENEKRETEIEPPQKCSWTDSEKLMSALNLYRGYRESKIIPVKFNERS